MNWEDFPPWLDAGAKAVGIATAFGAVVLLSRRYCVKRREVTYPVSGEVGPNILGPEFVAVKRHHRLIP